MKHYYFSQRSLDNLEGVHPELRLVVFKALELSRVDFSVISGVRTVEEQRQLVADGKSQTMDSYHLPDDEGFGNAVDLYPYVSGHTSHDDRDYNYLARAMFAASQIHGFTVEWGGLWNGFVDKPHWQRVVIEA